MFSRGANEVVSVLRYIFFFSYGSTAPWGPRPRHFSLRRFTITLRETPRSVGLLWTSDQPVAETST
jgi:hypothetical protein